MITRQEQPISSDAAATSALVAQHGTTLYERMLLIRRFEERATSLYERGDIPGFLHSSVGQEATAVGACWPLSTQDVITSTHRGHGHCLAKGVSPQPMMAELMARRSGTNRGFGGSMHIADLDHGVYGANGIVAAGVPIAVGIATAVTLRGQRRVVVAFLGDGAVAQGAFHEAVNLAALWHLPLVILCENNGFAEFASSTSQHPVEIEHRARGYGIPYTAVDGNDVLEVAAIMADVVDRVRDGGGPHLIEARTYRMSGHYVGDPERYRDEQERQAWAARDPLQMIEARLVELGVTTQELTATDRHIKATIEQAVTHATSDVEPSADLIPRALHAPRQTIVERHMPGTGEDFRVMDAVRDALAYELEADPTVFVSGVDVGQGGNVFGLTRGLRERWPARVRDTPISESAIIGLAVGSAMDGLRPVVELMYLDFLGVCLDQVMNQAAKLRWMTGGHAPMALTIRTQFGAGRSSGSQHSQSLEAILAGIPGLTVVMPSTPADTYGLLRSAIRDDNPVVFIENRLLYGRKGPEPPADHLVPLGSAVTRRRGTDVTLVSYSRLLFTAIAAAEEAASMGVSVEVIDLRTIAPWDRDTIFDSVRRTSRLVIAHDAVTDFGVGAEIAASVADTCIWHLDAPIRRIGADPTPAPYAPTLERAWLPDQARIVEALCDVVRAS